MYVKILIPDNLFWILAKTLKLLTIKKLLSKNVWEKLLDDKLNTIGMGMKNIILNIILDELVNFKTKNSVLF